MLTCRGSKGQLPSTEQAGGPSEHVAPLGVNLPLNAKAPRRAPLACGLLQNGDRGFPQPRIQRLNEKMNLQLVVGAGPWGAAPREDYREVRNRYRKCEKYKSTWYKVTVVILNDSKIPHWYALKAKLRATRENQSSYLTRRLLLFKHNCYPAWPLIFYS